MKTARYVCFIILVTFLASGTYISSSVQKSSANVVSDTGDRIVRVATTAGIPSGSRDQNIQNIDDELADAAKNNPDIIVLSEGAYSLQNWQPTFETIPGPFTSLLSDKAKEYNTYIAANMYEDGQDGHKYNTEVLINKQGQIVGIYHKVRLPLSETQGVYGMTEGTGPVVVDTELGKIGLEICYDIDIRFPEVTKATADAGAEIILVSSMGDYNHAAVQFARQNNIFMVTSVRDQSWTDAYPVSGIIANDGTIINGIDKYNSYPLKTCYADINLTQKTWSAPDPTSYSGVTPPPVRTSIPFTDVTASDSFSGKGPQYLVDGSIDNIDAGPDKGHPYWSSAAKQPSVILDMGSIKQLGSVGVCQFDTFNGQNDYFRMYFSQDGINYYEYTKGYNYGFKAIKDYNTGAITSFKCFAADFAPGLKLIEVNPPLDVRYIKIVGYGNNTSNYKATNLTEVTAFEPLDPSATSGPFPTMIPTPTPTKTPKPSVTPSPTPAPTPPYSFNDVPDDHWAKEQIYSLATKKIIAGYKNEDGSYSFRPGENIKRSEFIKILTVAFGVYNANSVYDGFTDVNKSSWYYSYVASAVNEGLTSGISADKFGSDLDISRQDLATFIGRALTKYKRYVLPDAEHTSSAIDKFIDNSQIQDYAKPSVALLADNAVINGYNEGGSIYFKPFNNASRAEVAKIADKSLQL